MLATIIALIVLGVGCLLVLAVIMGTLIGFAMARRKQSARSLSPEQQQRQIDDSDDFDAPAAAVVDTVTNDDDDDNIDDNEDDDAPVLPPPPPVSKPRHFSTIGTGSKTHRVHQSRADKTRRAWGHV